MTTSGSPSSAYSPTSTIGGCSPRLGINNTGATSSPSLPGVAPDAQPLLIHLAMFGHLVVVGQIHGSYLDGEVPLDPGRNRSLTKTLLPIRAGAARPRRRSHVRHRCSPSRHVWPTRRWVPRQTVYACSTVILAHKDDAVFGPRNNGMALRCPKTVAVIVVQ